MSGTDIQLADSVTTVTTTTNLTNLPTIPANWLTAAGTAADFGTEIGTAVWATAARTLTANTNFNDLDAAGVATAVWNAATITYGGAGTYGQAVEDIVEDTNELQGDWTNAGRLDAILDELTVNVDAVEADTQDLQTQIGAAGAGLTAITGVQLAADQAVNATNSN